MLKFFLVSLSVIALLLVSVLVYGHYSFKKQVSAEVRTMFQELDDVHADVVSEEEVIQLPEPVERWIRYSGVVGKPKALAVRLKQEGKFRQTPKQDWLPFEAEEYYTTHVPAFIWAADMQAGSLFRIAARDRLEGNRGNMLIKLLSLFTVADVYSDELDRGTMLRYLDEIIWFPSAALSEYILWEQVDENSAQATLTYGGISVSARFFFDKEGRVVNVVSERHRQVDGTFIVERWSTPLGEYGEFNGIKVPVKGKAVWNLESGDFEYFDVRITDVEYNRPNPY
jgi:hypothetical protein